MPFELVIVIALVLANGLFSGAELAIVASRRGRLRSLADDGDDAARAALQLAANPDRFLPTVQIGVTLVGTLAAAYGGERLVGKMRASLAAAFPDLAAAAEPIALTAFVLGLSFFMLLVGELVPKRLALRHPETFARLAAMPIAWLSWVAAPLVWGLNTATAATLWLLGQRTREEPTVSVDDIEQLLETGRAEGVLEAVEQAVAAEALRLGERTVRDIMRPRIEIDALDIDTPASEILGAIAMAGYSRLPVYQGSLDRIIGYISTKDILRTSWMGWPIELGKLMRRPVFVPETMPLDRLLGLFQKYGFLLCCLLQSQLKYLDQFFFEIYERLFQQRLLGHSKKRALHVLMLLWRAQLAQPQEFLVPLFHFWRLQGFLPVELAP